MFKKIELWVVVLLIIGLLCGAILFGAVVLGAAQKEKRFGTLGQTAILIAETPDTLRALTKPDTRMEVFSAKRFPDQRGWWFSPDMAQSSPGGYLLVSRYDGDLKRHVVELTSLTDGHIVHSWHPDADALLAGIPHNTEIASYDAWTTQFYRAIHPLLLPNGNLILKDHQSSLFEVDACSQKVWHGPDALFHHSTESDGAGGYWIPSYIDPTEIPGASPNFRDDSLAHVSGTGQLIWDKSVAQVFIDNQQMAVPFTAGAYRDDPLHVNDIQPALQDGPYWQAGDLFVSLRHISTVLLYRPATNTILWQKKGPWMAQHDVDILDDHRIAVFDNAAFDKGKGGYVDGTSEVLVYDFATDTVTSPYKAAMIEQHVVSLSEGLSEILPDGSVFIEEENAGRLLLLGPDGSKRMEYINRADDGTLYRLGWSRPIDAKLGEAAIASLAASDCPVGPN